MKAIGRCYSGRHAFTYDPDTVDTVMVNPATGRILKPGEDPEGAVKELVCPQCLFIMDTYRKQLEKMFGESTRK